MDLANWMGDLPSVLHSMPLNWLAIPGSHDSFSYTITPHSKISPDEENLRCLNQCLCLTPLVKRIICKWTVTQYQSCLEQLQRGIRYFDLRLASDSGTTTPFIAHGMFGSDVVNLLEDVREFLGKHPKEIVLLDFQHFYDFTDAMHNYLIEQLERIFEGMLVPFHVSDLALSSLWKSRYQVVAFYRNDYTAESPFMWPSKYLPTPWPNTVDPAKMIETLEHNYKVGRVPEFFYVTQGVLTPTTCYILMRLYTTLEQNIAPKATGALLDWIADKTAGKQGINVVIADCIDMQPFNFSSKIIGLNYKFANNLTK